MTRSELMLRMSKRFPQFSQADVSVSTVTILDAISSTLAKGGRVEIRGFGVFSLNHRPPRVARNPKTGVPVEVSEKWAPHFRAGKELRELVDATTKTLPL